MALSSPHGCSTLHYRQHLVPEAGLRFSYGSLQPTMKAQNSFHHTHLTKKKNSRDQIQKIFYYYSDFWRSEIQEKIGIRGRIHQQKPTWLWHNHWWNLRIRGVTFTKCPSMTQAGWWNKGRGRKATRPPMETDLSWVLQSHIVINSTAGNNPKTFHTSVSS